jgi:hypothetical protein
MRNLIQIVEDISNSAFSKKIEKIAKMYGVSIDSEIYNEEIRLWEINRPTSSKPGNGALAIRAIQTIAKENDLTVALAAAEGDPNLIAYYMKLGFKVSGETDSEKWLENYRKKFIPDEDNEAIVMRWFPT